ncbi:MAG: hypothetical protein HRT47_03475 [Candidatus Caenarcaniphilales bacterium]|nr:hypothetical protein [Candidatus Caenarcaniphilales bacterium]
MVTGARDFIESLPEAIKGDTIILLKQTAHIDKSDGTFNKIAKVNLNSIEKNFGKLLDKIEEYSDTISDSSSRHTDFAILIKNLEAKINHQYEKFGLIEPKETEENNIVPFLKRAKVSETEPHKQRELAVA